MSTFTGAVQKERHFYYIFIHGKVWDTAVQNLVSIKYVLSMIWCNYLAIVGAFLPNIYECFTLISHHKTSGVL